MIRNELNMLIINTFNSKVVFVLNALYLVRVTCVTVTRCVSVRSCQRVSGNDLQKLERLLYTQCMFV